VEYIYFIATKKVKFIVNLKIFNVIGKIKWVLVGVCFWVLKKLLRYRLQGESAKWLQPIQQNNVSIFNREDFILNYCKGKRVLHIGFSDYPYTKEKVQRNELLHTKIKQKGSYVLGIDNDINSIAAYSKATGDYDVAYTNILEEYTKEIVDKNFDVIVLSEVLEHLSNPYKAVKILHNAFKQDTKIVVTVPNYTSLDSFAASLNNTESIHQHHYWYFSPFTIQKLFNKEQFKCEQIQFGMYYNSGVKINQVLKNNAFTGDCIMAIFTIKSQSTNEE
jgi:2-polyprenyl-3-methyl-5-hydroxy-6-metoxy-1,4-benzoquinol methylase